MSNEDVSELIRRSTQSDYAVIDVRRNDHAVSYMPFRLFPNLSEMVDDRQGGHVRGSSQWPAQTFYDDLDQFYEKFKNVGKVIFYCNRSNGRGPRCAGWWAIL